MKPEIDKEDMKPKIDKKMNKLVILGILKNYKDFTAQKWPYTERIVIFQE